MSIASERERPARAEPPAKGLSPTVTCAALSRQFRDASLDRRLPNLVGFP